MVKRYPTSIEELKQRREKVPESEVKFFELVSALNDDWYAWHSVKWDYEAKKFSGEADFLVFNANYGFVVIEVKGGFISVENGIFYSTHQKTFERHQIKDPFTQAETSMHSIREFYVEKAKRQPNPSELLKEGIHFPLSFDYAVFFPDTPFKSDFERLQFRFFRIYDSIDHENQLDWMKEKKRGASPLEKFLINLLEHHKDYRIVLPKVLEFFPQMIGSNISKYVSLKNYFTAREIELEQINQVQDYLLTALSKKNRCIFRGSAGSGKTFIAMKKILLNFSQDLKTLYLCFNVELREFVKDYLSKKLGEPFWKLESKIEVYSIRLFLSTILKEVFKGDILKELMEKLKSDFSYEHIAEELKKHIEKIPPAFKYDAIIIDEAQDIDRYLWDLFAFFLKSQEESIFYVLYDEEQAVFVKHFSPKRFCLDEKSDLIVLNKNLRNSIEIARWIETRTNFGNYDEYSGINGFKVKLHTFTDSREAISHVTTIIKKKYFSQNIGPDKIIILAYYKLSNLLPNVNSDDELGNYIFFKKSAPTDKEMILIEPHELSDLPNVKRRSRTDWICVFKTITSFKGLERDIVFLIVPDFEDFQKLFPEKYDNFMMQVYIGASRAKFSLNVIKYRLSNLPLS